MYNQFFGFNEKPFSQTPDTRYLYLSRQHDEALSTLLYGIENRCGFMLLTGEVGSGKTTMIRTLLNLLSDSVETCLVLNSLLNTLDLLKSINRDFGNDWQFDSHQKQIEILNQFLLEVNQSGKTVVVIIDEAQNLSNEALEMTRMLSNLETETAKLITIILAGQPELEEKLSQKEMRQLSQRIQIHARLKPFSLDQTKDYIAHRISCSGDKTHAQFKDEAIKRIYKKTRGIPRLINNLCDLGLLAAFSQSTYVVDKKIIQRALKEVPQYVYYS
ncbi:MAG: AAA family ATPase [Deltaproteobacteria bacterium]|nr:AAA family ATPase [Deltaproteobacteria bacterium]